MFSGNNLEESGRARFRFYLDGGEHLSTDECAERSDDSPVATEFSQRRLVRAQYARFGVNGRAAALARNAEVPNRGGAAGRRTVGEIFARAGLFASPQFPKSANGAEDDLAFRLLIDEKETVADRIEQRGAG